jgi:hypothetical protein
MSSSSAAITVPTLTECLALIQASNATLGITEPIDTCYSRAGTILQSKWLEYNMMNAQQHIPTVALPSLSTTTIQPTPGAPTNFTIHNSGSSASVNISVQPDNRYESD